MNDMEKQIRRTFHEMTEGLEPSPKVKEEIFKYINQMNPSYSFFIRIPVALSFFTTIIAVPISVY